MRSLRRFAFFCTALIVGVSFNLSALPVMGPKKGFNKAGNILISDRLNNRVIEVDRDGDILWQFGQGPNDVSENSPIGVRDAQRVAIGTGVLTLITAAGVTAGLEPACPSGCADNRVLLLDKNGTVVWQYGTFGVTGNGYNQLNTPVQATWLPNGHVLITDQGNNRVIEVRRSDRAIVWEYDRLSSPSSAVLLKNGNTLIADSGNNRAIEVSHALKPLQVFTADGSLDGVGFASRLDINDHTLLTDTKHNRIVEVDSHDNIVTGSDYFTNMEQGSNEMPLPSRGLRLDKKQRLLIADQFNHRVFIVTRSKDLFRSFGALNTPGYSTDNVAKGGLNAPCDAKVIHDYTGLTPPGGFDPPPNE